MNLQNPVGIQAKHNELDHQRYLELSTCTDPCEAKLQKDQHEAHIISPNQYLCRQGEICGVRVSILSI